MRNLGWIIFLVIVVAQVIGGIAQKASKQKKKQQAQGRAPSGRTRATVRTPTSASPSGPAGMTPTAAAPGRDSARLDDLAARRKAQLEELRRKRGAASSRAPSARTARTARAASVPPATPPVSRPTPKPTKRIQTLGADYRAMRQSEEAEQRRRERERRRGREIESEQTRRREVRDLRREAQAKARRGQTVETPGAAAKAPVESGAPQTAYERRARDVSEHSTRIHRLLSQRQTLRDLFIIKELLEPPVSLREPARASAI